MVCEAFNIAERMQKDITRSLRERFKTVPHEIIAELKSVQAEARLEELVGWAAICPDLDAFRARLS